MKRDIGRYRVQVQPIEEARHNRALITGIVAGGIAGLAVGLWRAPQPGSKTRAMVVGMFNQAFHQVEVTTDRLADTVGQAASSAKQVTTSAKSQVAQVGGTAKAQVAQVGATARDQVVHVVHAGGSAKHQMVRVGSTAATGARSGLDRAASTVGRPLRSTDEPVTAEQAVTQPEVTTQPEYFTQTIPESTLVNTGHPVDPNQEFPTPGEAVAAAYAAVGGEQDLVVDGPRPIFGEDELSPAERQQIEEAHS